MAATAAATGLKWWLAENFFFIENQYSRRFVWWWIKSPNEVVLNVSSNETHITYTLNKNRKKKPERCDRRSKNLTKYTHTSKYLLFIIIFSSPFISFISASFSSLFFWKKNVLTTWANISWLYKETDSGRRFECGKENTLPIFIVFNITKQVNMWWTWLNQLRFFYSSSISFSSKKKNLRLSLSLFLLQGKKAT